LTSQAELHNRARNSDRAELSRILLVSTAEFGGGAETSARSLFNVYRSFGYSAELAVGARQTDDPDVTLIPRNSDRHAWARFWIRASKFLEPFEGQIRGMSRARGICNWVGEPLRALGQARGHEDFNFPGTWKFFGAGGLADIVHCFNLHENYFDLRILPWLSSQRPVLLDLRDAWLLSGHCAHSLDCERWKTGCGQCPYLRIDPEIVRDGTSFNWRRKKDIYARSRVWLATPSQWLMNKVQESMLAPAIIESRVIPTGIDLSTFRPADRMSVRSRLHIPAEPQVLLFTGNKVRRNTWKDFATIEAAVRLVSESQQNRPLLLIALGEDGPEESIGRLRIRFVQKLKNARDVAAYYQAADVYVHAATAETFPRAVLEALACGTPVVATAVGGIPEQIKSLWNGFSSEQSGATGITVPPADPQSMAAAIEALLSSENLSEAVSRNAAAVARERFDLKTQATRYLDWYREMVTTGAGGAPPFQT
jgi:glycosyltransferase involved in cell wall biosynthesis